ncbi:sugar nucleotidyltransferase [Thalassospira profundimaris]|uniref:glucose-1-phosphate thymidylyltransferase n=1 Tax=Thalassospira profundimaris TaxID=502049 RepID=A0A367WKZ4_9PROT|nr:sugar phosphate nucleotidyltransferase [Thalassospira profundimaris]RCK42094.1 glucose-1-phosphate thymidylyltransferase [Thalassospira profundimaris]
MNGYKGIILAGGSGTRLYPSSGFVCKQLFPIYDKPMIYYPLTTLILGGITEVLVISTPRDLDLIKSGLGDGSRFGISIEYAVQETPAGIAQAFLIAEEFLAGSPSVLILGDNLFYKSAFRKFFQGAIQANEGATIFGYSVPDPQRFGIIESDPETGKVLSLVEKPMEPKTSIAAVGLYIYDETVVEKTKSLESSHRGELEITDLNNLYLQEGRLKARNFTRGDFWIDAGVFEALNDACNFVRLNQSYTGLLIGSPEEASLHVGNISKEQLYEQMKQLKSSDYVDYLLKLSGS